MGDQGDIGWYLKLETLQNKKQPENEIKKSKGKEMIKQPFFQFRYSE